MTDLTTLQLAIEQGDRVAAVRITQVAIDDGTDRAAYMAGLVVGYWASPADCLAGQQVDRVFTPQMSAERRDRLYAEWTEAVHRSMGWAKK